MALVMDSLLDGDAGLGGLADRADLAGRGGADYDLAETALLSYPYSFVTASGLGLVDVDLVNQNVADLGDRGQMALTVAVLGDLGGLVDLVDLGDRVDRADRVDQADVDRADLMDRADRADRVDQVDVDRADRVDHRNQSHRNHVVAAVGQEKVLQAAVDRDVLLLNHRSHQDHLLARDLDLGLDLAAAEVLGVLADGVLGILANAGLGDHGIYDNHYNTQQHSTLIPS